MSSNAPRMTVREKLAQLSTELLLLQDIYPEYENTDDEAYRQKYDTEESRLLDLYAAALETLLNEREVAGRKDQIMIDAIKYDLCLDVDESEILKTRDRLLAELSDRKGQQ